MKFPESNIVKDENNLMLFFKYGIKNNWFKVWPENFNNITIKIVTNVGHSTFSKCDKSLTITKVWKIIDLKVIKNNQNLDCAKNMIFQNEDIKNLKLFLW